MAGQTSTCAVPPDLLQAVTRAADDVRRAQKNMTWEQQLSMALRMQQAYIRDSQHEMNLAILGGCRAPSVEDAMTPERFRTLLDCVLETETPPFWALWRGSWRALGVTR